MKYVGLTQRLLFCVWFALPLIFLPNSANHAQLVRFIVLAAIAGLAIASLVWQRTSRLLSLNRTVLIGSGIMVGCVIVTWVARVTSPFQVFYTGVDPEYLGFVTWLAFIAIGLSFAGRVRQVLFCRPALVIGGLSLIISLLFNVYDIRQGLPISGVMYQPLALAMYANFLLILYLQQLREKVSRREQKLLVIGMLACTITTTLCQTLIGTMLMVAVLVMWSATVLRERLPLRICLLVIAVIAAVLPTCAPGFFANIRANNSSLGLSNKVALYKQYVPAVVHHEWFFGQGPESLPETVNNQNYVPEDILKNLDTIQSSIISHDLFLDTSYFFGLVAGITLIVVTSLGLKRCFLVRRQNPAYGLALLVLFIDALFDRPSLLLTGMYFVVLFGAFTKLPAQKDTA